ncbi:hypothetical protein IFU33_12695 [Pantoea agglomerans]|uniref:hypothetical protein n=1 Tax=Enterobacter agglomerans TaxID=549 RepID=UPI00177EB0E2|nr:hypothetical protein [Pantoea agglomerans]WVJ45279.1 hypothetical protein IFU33_12695 [Pantoea agglomerans]
MKAEEYPYAVVIAVYPTFRHFFGDWVLNEYRSEHSGPFQWKKRIDVVDGFKRIICFSDFDEARERAESINLELQVAIANSDEVNEVKNSLYIKAEKAIKAKSRLQKEEKLMLNEAMKITSEIPRPSREEIKLSEYYSRMPHEGVLNELMEEINQNPLIKIAHLKNSRVVLGKSPRSSHENHWEGRYAYIDKATQVAYREKIASAFGFSGKDHWGKVKSEIRIMLLPRANELLQLASVKRMLSEAKLRGQKVLMAGSYVFWYEEEGSIGWIVKASNNTESNKSGETLWHEGTILSKNHGRIVVFPYIKENGDKVQGHTKNAPHDGKAKPRHPSEYLELPFDVIDEDLMIGLFGELNYD